MSNDAGALYGSGPNDTYFLNAPGGGLNQLHITTDSSTAGLAGQVTLQSIATSSTSGMFYVSTTGGRGYNDDNHHRVFFAGPNLRRFQLESHIKRLSMDGFDGRRLLHQHASNGGADKEHCSRLAFRRSSGSGASGEHDSNAVFVAHIWPPLYSI